MSIIHVIYGITTQACRKGLPHSSAISVLILHLWDTIEMKGTNTHIRFYSESSVQVVLLGAPQPAPLISCDLGQLGILSRIV